MSKGSNIEKINRIIEHWYSTGKSLKECITVVEPDIKIEVLENIFNNLQKKIGK